MPTATTDRGAMEAEQAVIGGMLIDPEAVHRVTGLLTEGDFTRAEHRRAYNAIRGLVIDGHQPELLMVVDRIRRDYPREVPGELVYLGELAHYTPSAANIEAYARRVAERAAARRVMKALAAAQDALANRADLAPVLAELEARIESVTARADGSLAWSGVVQRALDAMDEAAARVSAGGSVGVRTGIDTLDERTGGLHGPRLWVIAARPSLGKTAMALQWALHASGLGHRVGICSLEMSAEELGVRALAHVSGINVSRLFNGEAGAFSGVTPYLEKLTDRGIWLDDSTYPLSAIVSRITAWRREHKIDFAIVDHIGLVEVESADGRNDALGQVTRALKKTAKRLDMPIVAISQLSRGVEKDKRRPRLSDLRDSGSIEQDADYVLMIHSDGADAPVVDIELGLVKTRTGRKGWSSYKFTFDGRVQKFTQQLGMVE